MPGHQVSPLLPLPLPQSPGLIHRRTLVLILLQSHQARVQTRTVHAQENAMTGVGDHEDAAFHANHRGAETAVAVLSVDALDDGNADPICRVLGFFLFYTASAASIRQSNYSAKYDILAMQKPYRSDSKRHGHAPSDAFVFMINATMSLTCSSFNHMPNGA